MLTLRLDADALARARRVAARRGTSVSGLVEGYLRALSEEAVTASEAVGRGANGFEGGRAAIVSRFAGRSATPESGAQEAGDDRATWRAHLDARYGSGAV